jgi:hypothetical protein
VATPPALFSYHASWLPCFIGGDGRNATDDSVLVSVVTLQEFAASAAFLRRSRLIQPCAVCTGTPKCSATPAMLPASA